MTVYLQCNYCGGPIEDDDLHVTIDIRGRRPMSGARYPEHVNEYFGHFHTEPVLSDGSSCEEKMLDAMWLARSFGPTLETIETKSGQWVGRQRRKHTKPDEEG